MARVKVGKAYGKSRGDRKPIRGFSVRSRKGLFDWLNSIDWEHAGLPVFVTLTYGQKWPVTIADCKDNLVAFCRRLERAWEKVGVVWRLEFQQRGAPHFHLLVFGLPFVEKGEVGRMWGEVVGAEYWDTSVSPARFPFTRIESVRSVHGVKAYAAKAICGELAKTRQACAGGPMPGGSPTSSKSGMGTAPPSFGVGPCPNGFNSVTNLDAEVAGSTDSVPALGRLWGIRGRDFVPRVEEAVIEVPWGPVAGEIVEKLRVTFRRSSRWAGYGFTWYKPDAAAPDHFRRVWRGLEECLTGVL